MSQSLKPTRVKHRHVLSDALKSSTFLILHVCGYIEVANTSHVFACHSSYTSVSVYLIVIKVALWVLIWVHQRAAMLIHDPSAYDFTQQQVFVYWRASAHFNVCLLMVRFCTLRHISGTNQHKEHPDSGLCVRVPCLKAVSVYCV